MSEALPVDTVALRDEVKAKYRDVAVNPHGTFHFHTGRPLARRLGYNESVVAQLPESAIEAFVGVGNPFSQGALNPGERVVDLGSGGGFDCFVAAEQVGPEGRVVGLDMTDEMLERSRAAAKVMGLGNVEFRNGIIEELPVEDGWADVVISNGVINLCADKRRVFNEGMRVLRQWTVAVRRHRNRQGCAGSGCPQHRPMDRLNCWWPAVRRLAAYVGRKRVRSDRYRPAGRHLRWCWWGA